MQTTSQTWKDLFAAGAPLEARATIGGTVVTAISQPVITRACMQESMGIGNVAAASLALAVRGTATIPRSASVFVETRLNDGETASEWLPQGTFYIARRSRDPVTGAVALECYDALLKANAVWEPSAGSWPRAMGAVLTELLALLGLTLDSRSVIPSGAPFAIAEPAAGTTIRDVLGVIAQAGGGNWIVTPENRLRLVPLADAAAAAAATADAVDVNGVTGGMDAGPTGTITGVRCTVDGVVTLTGDETGIVVDVSIAPVIAAELAETLIGRRYQAYSLAGAVCDPAAELGDYVRAGAGGEIASVLYGERLDLGPACRCDVSAPQAGEVTDEYPYIGGSVKALTLAKAYADEAVEALDSDLTQQEIFNRLTDDGAAQGLVLYNGQLYINASYINAGEIRNASNTNNYWNLITGELSASQGALGEWTIDTHGLSKTTTSPIGKVENTITPNGIVYKETRFPGTRDAVRQTMLSYATISFARKEGDGPWANSEIWGDMESDTNASILKLIARPADVSYDSSIVQLTSKDHSDGGTLTVDAKLKVMGDVSFDSALPVASGGTGATTPAGARANIGARADTAPTSGNWFRGTPVILYDGGMEIGRYIDFHATDASTGDNDVRLMAYTTGLTINNRLAFNRVTNAIAYYGTQAQHDMIRFIDNTVDASGNGITIGGGGAVIIGGGESASEAMAQQVSGGSEVLYLCNDGDVHVLSNMQNGWASRKTFTFGANGTLTAPAFSGPLTGNVTGNCSGSSGSCTGNAATATKATQDGNGNNIASTYLPKSGGTMTGGLTMSGTDITLATFNAASDDSGDLVFNYGNGTEKSRIWTANSYTAEIGPNYRVYNKENNHAQIFSGTLALANSAGVVQVGHGGTGATTAAGARTNLGIQPSVKTVTTDANGYADLGISTEYIIDYAYVQSNTLSVVIGHKSNGNYVAFIYTHGDTLTKSKTSGVSITVGYHKI